MNNKLIAVGLLAFTAACNDVDSSFVYYQLVPGTFDEDTLSCSFEAGGEVHLSPIIFETNVDRTILPQPQLRLHAELANNFTNSRILLDTNPTAELVPNETITPVRFDYRWECEPSGLSAEGPVFLPSFSTSRAFCVPARDDGAEFVGFDVVPANGPPIKPAQRSIAVVTPVSSELGAAMNDLFSLSVIASACCEDPAVAARDGQCTVLPSDLSGGSACNQLNDILERFGLSALNEADVTRWLPFAAHVGATDPLFATFPGLLQSGRSFDGSALNMRIRGYFEGISSTGRTIVSTELVDNIGFCKQCLRGGSTPCTL